MAGRQAGGGGEPPGSPRGSPPKVVVDESPLQPAMGKHKESLKVKLMMRRPINQLVAQGIMPPLKTPPAYFEQCKQLERAKTGDLLKAKIQRRPDRQELERRHILEQESHVDPSLAEKQRMLKKARLADQLNDQLSHRPGPLELIKKNILHTEETIETAVKSGVLAFKATSEGASGRPEHPSSYCGPPDEVSSPSPSPPSTLSPASVASPPQHPAPGKDKNRKKSKQKQQPKARFKFHEYKGPPNAQKASSPPDMETPYELLLQQQQLLLQLMLPASPAASVASAASDCSDALPPPPPPPPAPLPPHSRFEDMKVSDLRAECKRRNLRVSGPKPQLIDRLRPFLGERPDEPPHSPASVASVPSVASLASLASPERVDDAEDIVQSQRRQIEELERKLEASRQQLESVRRGAGAGGGAGAGAAAGASDQSRRLLQAHIYVSQLRAQLDALQAPAPPPPPRYVLADAAPDRLVRLFAVTPPPAPAAAAPEPKPAAAPPPAYILNGVKVVPIAILPTHFEPERPTPAPAPAPPPPPPMPRAPSAPPAPPLDRTEDSQIMDDVLEILVENGELPPSAVVEPADAYVSDADSFSPADVLGDAQIRESLAADELQRELDDIQNEIMTHSELRGPDDGRAAGAPEIDADLGVELLSPDSFRGFGGGEHEQDTDEFFRSLLAGGGGGGGDERAPQAMDVGDDHSERAGGAPLTNGVDLLDHSRHGFDDMDDLSLPSFQNEDTRNGNFDPFEERSCDFDLKEFVADLGTNMNVDGDAYEYMDTDAVANHFGRGHVPQRDPLLGGVARPPAAHPAVRKQHYSWDRIEFDAT